MCTVTFENSPVEILTVGKESRYQGKNQLPHTQHLPVVIQIPCEQTAEGQSRLTEGGA